MKAKVVGLNEQDIDFIISGAFHSPVKRVFNCKETDLSMMHEALQTSSCWEILSQNVKF